MLKESRVFRNTLTDIRRDESVRIVAGGWTVGIPQTPKVTNGLEAAPPPPPPSLGFGGPFP